MSGNLRQPVYLGLGSNIQARHYLSLGLDELQRLFGALDISAVYQSEAVGFTGPAFFNLVVGVHTHLGLGELAQTLRQLEYDHGRTEDCSKQSSRTLDIDILTYGDQLGCVNGIQLPRDEITTRTFVLRPFADIAGSLVIPGQTRCLASLWQNFPQRSLPLVAVNFTWRDRTLPCRTAPSGPV